MAHSHRRPDLFFRFALQIKSDENFPIAGWQRLEDSRCDFLRQAIVIENSVKRLPSGMGR